MSELTNTKAREREKERSEQKRNLLDSPYEGNEAIPATITLANAASMPGMPNRLWIPPIFVFKYIYDAREEKRERRRSAALTSVVDEASVEARSDVVGAESGYQTGECADDERARGLNGHVGHGSDGHAAGHRRVAYVDHVEAAAAGHHRGEKGDDARGRHR